MSEPPPDAPEPSDAPEPAAGLGPWLLLGGMLLTVPVSWPAWRALHAVRLVRWRRAGEARKVTGADVQALAGRVRRATRWVRVDHTIASGGEELERLELRLDDGDRACLDDGAPGYPEALAALRAAGVSAPVREAQASGIGLLFGWVLWAGVTALTVALASGAMGAWIVAGTMILALAALFTT